MNKEQIDRALDDPGCERLRDFYEAGPAHRAALETFVSALRPGEPVAWIPSSVAIEYITRCADGTQFIHVAPMPAHAVEWRYAAPADSVPCSFPERDQSKAAEQQGLFRKFVVHRVDGSDQPGGKHHGCEYFVLDMVHDEHAPAALRAYAAACKGTHPQLSADLVARFGAASADSVAVPREPTVGACDWTQDQEGIWYTGCGTAFIFDAGSPEENSAHFCHKCGGSLLAIPFSAAPKGDGHE